MTDVESLVRGYYRDLDAGAYDALADRLTPSFRHVRGDRTLDGRETFVGFMRDERPLTDTAHSVDAVYLRVGTADPPAEVAVRGELRRADGTRLFGFVDVFALAAGRLDRLVTYSTRRVE